MGRRGRPYTRPGKETVVPVPGLLPSAELALIWFPQRPAGQQAMFSDEDALPGSVVAAPPCRGAARAHTPRHDP